LRWTIKFPPRLPPSSRQSHKIELYPDDPIVNTNVIWLSDYDWDYDFQNVDELRGTDFWNAYGYWGFGNEKKNMTTASTQHPWPGGEDQDFIFDLDQLGLYRFEANFVEQDTNDSATNSIYRVLGEEISENFKGVWGGVTGAKEGVIYLNHENFDIEGPLEVHNGAFFGDRQWAGVFDERTGYYNSIPGKVFITFIDSKDGKIYHTQRNIDYGSWNGNQMFLIDVQQPSQQVDQALISAIFLLLLSD
jgi:hypothetical protein